MSKCMICGGDLPAESFLSLPSMPACAQNIPSAKELDKDVGIDLNLYQCDYCGLVQLDCPPVFYYKDVIRAGGGTSTMLGLRRAQYRHFIDKCGLEGKRILEVGCGQGEFLQMFDGFDVVGYGIEHNDSLLEKAKAKGLNVFSGFADDVGRELPGCPYDAFVQFNFIEHQPYPNEMVRCIRNNLVPGGCGLVTAPDFGYIRNNCVYEIMRDHLAYYTPRTLGFLFEKNGFEVLERGIVNKDTAYVIVRRQELLTRQTFKTNYMQTKQMLNAFVAEHTSNGKTLSFWGASHQCFTAASFLDSPKLVKFIVDSATFKQGRYSPTSHILIVSPEAYYSSPTDVLLIIAPGYTDEIAQMVKSRMPDAMIFTLRSDNIEWIG